MHASALERRVERLLAEVEKPRSLNERCAYAIAHQKELAACIRDLLRFIGGTRTATLTLTAKASRLLDAVSPLLTQPGRPRRFADDMVHGEAPDLIPAAMDLRRYFEDDFSVNPEPEKPQ